MSKIKKVENQTPYTSIIEYLVIEIKQYVTHFEAKLKTNTDMFLIVFLTTVVLTGVCYDCFAVRTRNISAHYHENNDRYMFSGEIFKSMTESLLVCSTICASTDTCITASYNAFNGKCLIFGRIFPDPALYGLVPSYVEESGWRSFRGRTSYRRLRTISFYLKKSFLFEKI